MMAFCMKEAARRDISNVGGYCLSRVTSVTSWQLPAISVHGINKMSAINLRHV